MLTAWRIVKRKHARTAFTGEGARLYGGRWNSVGSSMVYTAQSQALAALEMVIHLESSDLLDHYVLFKIGIGESLVTIIAPSELPRNWRVDPPPTKVREIGDSWVTAGTSAVLQVPSAIPPAEHNFLLNPHHPDFPKILIGRGAAFRFDPRLAR
ncbi:MAG TPA: RES family NAD+ phosphorylase [Terriglobia bacterium]|nr:RES family NAD+ phosphorylase [Terriglobia bacterium]